MDDFRCTDRDLEADTVQIAWLARSWIAPAVGDCFIAWWILRLGPSVE